MSIGSIFSAASSARLLGQVSWENSFGRVLADSSFPDDAPNGVQSSVLRFLDFEGQLRELIQKLNLDNERKLISNQDESDADHPKDLNSVKDRANRVREDLFLQQEAALSAGAGLSPEGNLNLLA